MSNKKQLLRKLAKCKYTLTDFQMKVLLEIKKYDKARLSLLQKRKQLKYCKKNYVIDTVYTLYDKGVVYLTNDWYLKSNF